MDGLLSIGASHETAPVELRERLAPTPARVPELLHELTAAAEVREAVVIATCNRVELYLVASDEAEAEREALALLAARADGTPAQVHAGVRVHRNCDAARHLFRVASGLESMIVGEAEVQGQVRRAYQEALAAGTTGPLSNRLFRAALATGKRVRRETAIGRHGLSVPAVALALARELFGELSGRRVLVLGTGQTSELAARALAGSSAEMVFVANRSHDRAVALARRFEGRVAGYDSLPAELEAADVVVAATLSPHLVLHADAVRASLPGRGGRPLVLLDLAVPRDIDPACESMPGVALYGVDDLDGVIARNHTARRAEALSAEEIVEEEIQSFAAWLGSLEVLPTLSALRRHADRIACEVVGENASRWESASPRDLERVHAIAAAVVNRLLHDPTIRLKELRGERAHAQLQFLRDIFGLPGDAERGDEAPAEVRRLRRGA
jgi:glutamyl-tRNA reductase